MKKFLVLLCVVSMLVPQMMYATITVVISGEAPSKTATITTDSEVGETLTSSTNVTKDAETVALSTILTQIKECTTVVFNGNFTSIEDDLLGESSTTTVVYGNTTVTIGDQITVSTSATDGKADISKIRNILPNKDNKDYNFATGVQEVDFPTYVLQFSGENRTTATFVAKEGQTVSLSKSPYEHDVKFVKTNCTTIIFTGSGQFGELQAFEGTTSEATDYVVDFTNARFSSPSYMTFKWWSSCITDARGSIYLSTYPNDVIQSCSKLETLSFGNGTATIDRTNSKITISSISNEVNYGRVAYAFTQDGYNNYTKIYNKNITTVNYGDFSLVYSDFNDVQDKYTTVTVVANAETVALTGEMGNDGGYLFDAKQNYSTIKFRGTGTFTNIEAFQNNAYATTVDFSSATFADGIMLVSNWRNHNVTTVIYNNAIGTIDRTQANYPVTITGNVDADKETLKNIFLNSGWNADHITVVSSVIENTSYDPETKTFILKTKADATQADFVNAFSTFNACEAERIELPDGTYWVKDGEGGTLYCPNETYSTYKSWIEAACDGSKHVTKMQSRYVTVDYTTETTTITLPTAGTIGTNIMSGNDLTAADRAAIKAVSTGQTLKLVGPFNEDDVEALSNVPDEGTNEDPIHCCRPTTIDLSEAIIADGRAAEGAVKLTNQFKYCVENVILPTSSDYQEIPIQFFNNSTLKSIVIPTNITKIGSHAFQGCTGLTDLTFAEVSHLTDIGESAFERTDVTGVLTIPNSVEYIRNSAFKHCLHITTLIINEGSQLQNIEGQAFWMDNEGNDLKNVYVYENRAIACDGMAFDYINTDGQTVMSTVKTRLHYPADYYSFYVGEWKSNINGGKIEGHEDLLKIRNGVDDGLYIDNDNDGTPETYMEPTHIGWQKFISSGIPVTFDWSWRTYSDIVHLKVPASTVADVFVVCDFNCENGMATLKQMKVGDIIPAGTGILIHHKVTDETSGGVLMFPHLTSEEAITATTANANALKPYLYVLGKDKDPRAKQPGDDGYDATNPYLVKYSGLTTRHYIPSDKTVDDLPTEPVNYKGKGGYPNYLEALHMAGEWRAIYNAENGNITDWEYLVMSPSPSHTAVTYRNYFFGNGKKLNGSAYTGENFSPETDGQLEWGFFRCISDWYSVNSKAFLHLPADIFTTQGNTGGTGADSSAITEVTEAIISGAKGIDFYILDDNGETTGIATVTETRNNIQSDKAYYTLQGTKVVRPTAAGIYIHQGKKIVIK